MRRIQEISDNVSEYLRVVKVERTSTGRSQDAENEKVIRFSKRKGGIKSGKGNRQPAEKEVAIL